MVKLLNRLAIDTKNVADDALSVDDITGLTATVDELNLTDAMPANVTIALAAGAANTMTITMTVKDAAGATLAGVYLLDWWISEAATGIGLTADSYSGTVAPTTGTDLQIVVAKKQFRSLTATTGILVVAAVDTAKPADQYVVVRHPVTGKLIVSAVSGTNWG